MARTDDDLGWLRDDANLGGRCIVAPDGDVVAGPAGAEETTLVADLDLDALVDVKVIHDYAGHYNRPDVVQMLISEAPVSQMQAPWTAPAGATAPPTLPSVRRRGDDMSRAKPPEDRVAGSASPAADS